MKKLLILSAILFAAISSSYADCYSETTSNSLFVYSYQGGITASADINATTEITFSCVFYGQNGSGETYLYDNNGLWKPFVYCPSMGLNDSGYSFTMSGTFTTVYLWLYTSTIPDCEATANLYW